MKHCKLTECLGRPRCAKCLAMDAAYPPDGPCAQGRHPAAKIAGYAALIHYPEHWDVAAYPTLDSAVRETLAWAGCNACKNPDAYGMTPNVEANRL